MLFQLVSRRYQNKSTLITTNRAFGDVFTQQRGDD
jgi:DNA replication protein DnaC